MVVVVTMTQIHTLNSISTTIIDTKNATNKQTTSSSASASPATSLSAVELVHDRPWFRKKAKAGCCPFAVKLYHERYGSAQDRCCTDRLDEIEPLRPLSGHHGAGAANWASLMTTWRRHKKKNMKNDDAKNITITIQGDSLAEQHFVAMLCHVWSTANDDEDEDEEGAAAEVTQLINRSGNWQKAWWEAQIDMDPIGVTLSFRRWNTPNLIPDFDYTEPNVLIVGGWHHGGTSEKQITAFWINWRICVVDMVKMKAMVKVKMKMIIMICPTLL